MHKSPDAFRTISEVAELLDVPQHVLRFWETKFAQIKPLKRAGGRRYYRPADIELIRGIQGLLYGDGYTIKGVQRILKDQGVRFVMDTGRARFLGSDGAEDADEHAVDLDAQKGELPIATPEKVAKQEPAPEPEIEEPEPLPLEKFIDETNGKSEDPPQPAAHLSGEQRETLQHVLDDLSTLKAKLAAIKANK